MKGLSDTLLPGKAFKWEETFICFPNTHSNFIEMIYQKVFRVPEFPFTWTYFFLRIFFCEGQLYLAVSSCILSISEKWTWLMKHALRTIISSHSYFMTFETSQWFPKLFSCNFRNENWQGKRDITEQICSRNNTIFNGHSKSLKCNLHILIQQLQFWESTQKIIWKASCILTMSISIFSC